MRKLLVAVVVILVILVVADRVGEVEAGHVLASRIQTDEHLAQRPDVSVHGFPFLTQAIRGRYSHISVTADDVKTGSVRLRQVKAQLHGVRVPLGDVIHGSVQQVPVAEIDGTVAVSYAAINSYLSSRHLVLSQGSGGGGQVMVKEQVTVLGTSVAATGTGTVSVSNDAVHVSVARLGASVSGQSLSVPVDSAITVPLSGVPFHVRAATVRAGSSGLTVTGSVQHVELSSNGS